MVAPLVRQTWVASGIIIAMVGSGITLSFSSSLLPGLEDPDSSIKADLSTASWLASSVGITNVLGIFVSSYLMDSYGRRLAFAMAIVPGIVSWLFIFLAQDVSLLMVGRVLGGISAGATVALGAIGLGEYTSPENRGMFLNLKSAAVCVGGLFVHTLGHYVDWRRLALYALIPFITAFSIVCTWPESPSWLAAKGQFDKCEDSFLWLRGSSERAKRELKELIQSQKEQTASITKSSLLPSLSLFFKKFTQKDFIKPLLIVLFAGILSEASGRHIFPAYATQIIGSIAANTSQSFYYTISIDLIIIFSITFSSVLVKIIKRRSLLFSSGILSLLVLISVCIYLFLASNGSVPSDEAWIPLSMFVVYFILANLYCTPMPYNIIGEIFPLAHRGAGTAVTGISLSILLVIALKMTPYLLISLNVYGTFGIFALLTGLSLLVLYYILPETKDRTLQEIENYLNNGIFEYVAVKDVAMTRKRINRNIESYDCNYTVII